VDVARQKTVSRGFLTTSLQILSFQMQEKLDFCLIETSVELLTKENVKK
jgi:hypothetical protein